jgi:hypothetical protein
MRNLLLDWDRALSAKTSLLRQKIAVDRPLRVSIRDVQNVGRLHWHGKFLFCGIEEHQALVDGR